MSSGQIFFSSYAVRAYMGIRIRESINPEKQGKTHRADDVISALNDDARNVTTRKCNRNMNEYLVSRFRETESRS